MERRDNFEFKGFVPQLSLEQKGKHIYNIVENRSPSESAKVASITKMKEGYEAELKITSNSCRLKIKATENDCETALDQIYEQFLSEILNWDKARNSEHTNS